MQEQMEKDKNHINLAHTTYSDKKNPTAKLSDYYMLQFPTNYNFKQKQHKSPIKVVPRLLNMMVSLHFESN